MAVLRAVAGRRSADPAVTGLIDRLHAASTDFRRLWAEHEVAVRRVDRRTLLHPRVGRTMELLRVLGIEEFPAAVEDTHRHDEP